MSIWKISQPDEGPISFSFVGTDHAIAPDGAKLVACSSYHLTNLIGLLPLAHWLPIRVSKKWINILMAATSDTNPWTLHPPVTPCCLAMGWHNGSSLHSVWRTCPPKPAHRYTNVTDGTTFTLDGQSFLAAGFNRSGFIDSKTAPDR